MRLLPLACPLLFAQQPAPIPEGWTVHRDLRYISHAPPRQSLDLYLPPGDAPRPLLIWIHGGGWRSGDNRDPLPLRMLPNARYAVASVGYRLSQQAKFPAQIEDSKAAVRWLRANAGTYRLDPNRFAAWGESAGGHLAALLGVADGKFDLGENATVPSRVQAVVAFGAPVDLWRMGPGSLASDSAESQLVGGPLGENELVAARASPLRYVDGRDPPFLIVHAERDGQVPMEHARWLEAALRNVGVAATLHIAGGADPRSDAAVADAVRAFLERTIGR